MKLITINPNNEPYYSEDFIKGFKCGAQRQFEADKADRPQGEWIFDDPVSADFKCSECLERQDICTAFCPCCGADMRESMEGADDE